MANQRTAFITGSTQGIGRAIATRFVEAGYRVIVHCSADMEKAESVRREIGAHAAVTCDLSDMDQVRALHGATGEVDVLILNASVQVRRPWNEITEEDMDKQLTVNVKSTLRLIQDYAPAMQKQKFGRIIAIGSVQQYKPHKDMAIYAASKCAVMSMVKNLAKQLAPDGVTVNGLAPGTIDTPRNQAALSDEAYHKKVVDAIPVGYVGAPRDCADAALLLASEEARYITGTDLVVDGGMSL